MFHQVDYGGVIFLFYNEVNFAPIMTKVILP